MGVLKNFTIGSLIKSITGIQSVIFSIMDGISPETLLDCSLLHRMIAFTVTIHRLHRQYLIPFGKSIQKTVLQRFGKNCNHFMTAMKLKWCLSFFVEERDLQLQSKFESERQRAVRRVSFGTRERTTSSKISTEWVSGAMYIDLVSIMYGVGITRGILEC